MILLTSCGQHADVRPRPVHTRLVGATGAIDRLLATPSVAPSPAPASARTVPSPARTPIPTRAPTVEQQIHRVFGREGAYAVRVFRCESRLRPQARNGQHFGIPQIATKVHRRLLASMGYAPADMFKIGPSLRVAKRLRDSKQGWKHWRTCARRAR